jgi:hypothetical protein
MKNISIFLLAILFSTALIAQKTKPHKDVDDKVKTAASKVVPLNVEGAENAQISVEFVTPATTYKVAADGSVSEKVNLKFGSDYITCDFVLKGDESCTFKIGDYSLNLKGKGGADLKGGVWNYTYITEGLSAYWESAKKGFETLSKSISTTLDSLMQEEPIPKSIEQLRSRYNDTPPSKKIAEEEGGWSLDDGAEVNEALIQSRIRQHQLPGYLDYLLTAPEDDCDICEKWRESGHVINKEIIEALDGIKRAQINGNKSSMDFWKGILSKKINLSVGTPKRKYDTPVAAPSKSDY